MFEILVGKEFYIFYKGVVKENVESIKVYIVYNVLVREMGYVFLRFFF